MKTGTDRVASGRVGKLGSMKGCRGLVTLSMFVPFPRDWPEYKMDTRDVTWKLLDVILHTSQYRVICMMYLSAGYFESR